MNKYIYFLYFPSVDAIKIGITKELKTRISTLEKCWGNVDVSKSYFAEHKRNHRFEQAFHLIFAEYNKDFKEGDGHSEFFEPVVIDHIFQMDFLNIQLKSLKEYFRNIKVNRKIKVHKKSAIEKEIEDLIHRRKQIKEVYPIPEIKDLSDEEILFIQQFRKSKAIEEKNKKRERTKYNKPFKRSELKSATSFHHLLQIAFSEINKLSEYKDLSYDDFLENYVNKEEQIFIVGDYKVETTPGVGLYTRTIKIFDSEGDMVKGFVEV